MNVWAILIPVLLNVNSPSGRSLEVQLTAYGKEEVRIVGRIRNLREATEKLSDSWSANLASGAISKAKLIEQLGYMELASAERWNLLINNLALMQTDSDDLDNAGQYWRKNLSNLDELHRKVNVDLDRFNAALKEGILLKLANKIQVSSTSP